MNNNRPLLRQGSKGAAVRELQTMLRAVGLYADADIDGLFGPKTGAAVQQWQRFVPHLKVDQLVGQQTWASLDAAMVKTPTEPVQADGCNLDVSDATWSGFMRCVELLTTTPARYVPGRGAFDPQQQQWLVRDHSGTFPHGAPIGAHGFVCSTFTNWICGVLLRKNELYTPEGGMPPLSMLMEMDSQQHAVPGLPGAQFRGYGEHSTRLLSDIRDVRASTIYDRRSELPTFILAAQASRRNGWWLYHHTCLWVVDRRNDCALHRIAADGYRGSSGFSKTPMIYKRWTAEDCARSDVKSRFRLYGLHIGADIESQPMLPVVLE